MGSRRHFALSLMAVLAFPMAGCLDAPKVMQGKVVSYDPAARRLVVEDPGPPPAPIELLLAGAEVGSDPLPGDTVRIAYREQQGRRQATRVMNVTRQDKGAKGSGGH